MDGNDDREKTSVFVCEEHRKRRSVVPYCAKRCGNSGISSFDKMQFLQKITGAPVPVSPAPRFFQISFEERIPVSFGVGVAFRIYSPIFAPIYPRQYASFNGLRSACSTLLMVELETSSPNRLSRIRSISLPLTWDNLIPLGSNGIA